MSKIVHVLGNGDKSALFNEEQREGTILVCNMPPFEIDPKLVYATCMVDFKMMMALNEGSIALDQYDWVLGTRPRIWMEEKSAFYLKYASKVKSFYTTVPKYAGNPTNFNCGHMAAHYAANKHNADEIHLYGFDTLFDFNMRSMTDLILPSDREANNTYRLLGNWRPIWEGIFKEFKNTQFVLHHTHDDLQIERFDNVKIITYNTSVESKTKGLFDARGARLKGKSPEELKRKAQQDPTEDIRQGEPPAPTVMNRKQRRVYEAKQRKSNI
jgi:hypothetical protein